MEHPLRRLALVLVALSLLSCARGPQGGAEAPGGKPGEKATGDKVIVERLPDGRTRTTTIRTRAADPPPARPADPYPADPLVRYNVERLNAYRTPRGLAPLLYDTKISAFARAASERLARDHSAHAHFREGMKQSPLPPGFGSRSAENQGDPRGVPEMDPDPVKNGKKQIDIMLKLMMDEGPGGGHHDTIVNPDLRRVGVGLVYAGGKLYMTNDFSD